MANRRNAFVAALSFVVALSGVSTGWADEVTYWNNIALDIVKESATHPPKVGRDLAIMHSAMYDALNAIDRTHYPLFFEPPVTGPASREAAVAAAAHQTLVSLYPAYEARLNDLLNARLAAIPSGAAKSNGVALGQSVAGDMLALRASDGSNLNAVYSGGTAPGQWRPTPPGYKSGLAPLWGNVTPFSISSADDFRPGPPPALTSQQYAAAVEHVKSVGSSNSTTRTPDQTQIADFWSDFSGATATPVGKWNLIAQTLAEQQGNTLAENARMFALLDVALADAGIVCWDTKYTYGLWRPEDAIHLADTDGNPATQADPAWTPYLTTPAFPEYTSGHSTFSAAAAKVLGLFFGTDDIPFETIAGFDVLPGVTRSYDSLSEAALEAGLSRIYGGIHYDFSNITGRETGLAIADYVYAGSAQAIPVPESAVLAIIGAACLLRARRALRHPL
jgi:membrane-associated phospholipid phosphatase